MMSNQKNNYRLLTREACYLNLKPSGRTLFLFAASYFTSTFDENLVCSFLAYNASLVQKYSIFRVVSYDPQAN